MNKQDTIVAIATPPGQGGVGIVRVSGTNVKNIAKHLLGKLPGTRRAHYGDFLDNEKRSIDQGIAIYFESPHSFTGEDVLELHGHGGPVVLDLIVKRVIELGARAARAGEFSERAFLNDKIDLAQAEAIADLIAAESEQAAKAALGSLQGAFSKEIHSLVEELTRLRIYVESTLDFPEEEIDFLNDGAALDQLNEIKKTLSNVKRQARQGKLLKEGMSVVIVGKPNAGKSSLLNQLAGNDAAIVTDIPGTTRDVLTQHINIDGLPLHIIDTAGLRITEDKIEKEGMKRALQAIEQADRLLYVIDHQQPFNNSELASWSLPTEKCTYIHNKIDITKDEPGILEKDDGVHIYLSAKSGDGLDQLRQHLKTSMGYHGQSEGTFIARRRHLEAINLAQQYLDKAEQQLKQAQSGELMAEELKLAQQALATITGEFSADDLLGRIFADFCIGK